MHALWLMLALLRVEGDSRCPSPEAVQQAIAAMGEHESGDVAHVNTTPDGIEIVLSSADGQPKRTRLLRHPPGEDDDASCAELAQATAVVIAAWESELAGSALPSVRLTRPSPALDRVRLDVGAAFAAVLTGRSFAPGGAAELYVSKRRSRFGARLGFVGAAPRTLVLAPGDVDYTRYQIALGAEVRLSPSRLLIDFHASGVLGVLSLRARGFEQDRGALDVDPGIAGGARLAVRLGPVAPFVGAQVVGWLRREHLVVSGLSSSLDVPRWDLVLTVGLAALIR